MKIKYVHWSEPDREKIFDTEQAYRNSAGLRNLLNDTRTQEECDAWELKHLEEDKQKGYILSYEVMKEEEYAEMVNTARNGVLPHC